MIEFKVNLTKDCKQYLLNQQHKGMFFISIILATIFIIPLLIFTFLWKYAAIGTIPGIILVMGEVVHLNSRKTRLFKDSFIESIPTSIIIDGETIETVGIGELSYKCKNIQDIKEIWDMGTFYAVIFYFPNMDRRFICQKDLIVEGTIEEFEQLFEDKIVRKHETKD